MTIFVSSRKWSNLERRVANEEKAIEKATQKLPKKN